ncbi:hypothetical protein HMP0015_2138 [Acinetobacter haemolyticus ATCC 19194]|uniref:Uncharacterized protein n=1 Tax=Acinetobacter haemolyticus ATCC 19194 TaxID=707232 RepID=D4XQZ6_ACIHA|nr:hypothetical protein [Acinetobacter haemolyticus]EFF82415.1 hypothetical protein HMP0015_2138 [Acinetobacter haemolyticus ATCC 19194]
MENSSNIPKFPNTNTRVALAKRLNLAYLENMQDWEYEVADISRIDDFLNTYDLNDITEDERFLLIEMLFQSFEEADDLEKDTRWYRTLSLVENNLDLHTQTVLYWANGVESLEDSWNITPFVRNLRDQYNLKK